jgi:hypothetical protein
LPNRPTYPNSTLLKTHARNKLPLPPQVSAIDSCLREPQGRNKCATVQGEFGEEPSSGSFGGLF